MLGNEGFENKFPKQVVKLTNDNWDEVKEAIKRAAERQPGEPL